MKRLLVSSILSSAAVFAVASGDSFAQTKSPSRLPLNLPGREGLQGAAPSSTAPATAAPPVPQGGAGASNAAGASGGTGASRPGTATTPVVGPNGKAQADTSGLAQFETGVEFEPRNPNYRVAFSLEDADLPELVRVIGQLTGKRFIFGGKIRNIKATVFSPQKVTVAEAYQAFLSILETNGLTVVPHGRFLKIVETAGVATQTTPTFGPNQGAPGEDRYVTRMHRLQHVGAEEVSAVLGHFKTKDGDITVYAPGNMLIITDTGTNIRRMMQIVEDIDVGGAGDQIWIEPVHYAAATDVAARINDLFDVKAGASPSKGAPPGPGGPSPTGGGGELHVAKIVPDDRTNSLVIVATERAYLRILELIKRIDVPQSGEGEIHVLPLQHADATELTKTLTEIISGAGAPSAGGGAKPGAAGSPPQGIFEGGLKVSADKATNSIVVTSSLRDYAALRAVVDKLDMPRKQVFIEAVIMDLSITRANSLGTNFHLGDTIDTGHGNALAYGGLNPLKTIGLPDPTSLQGMALGLRGPGIPGSETLLGTGITIPAFGVLINALANSDDTDVLSTPHILATDNVAAEINVGENVPLQTNAGGALPNLGGAAGGAAGALGALGGLGGLGGLGFTAPRQDVGTKIKVIPHLNESNEVRLELTEEISEAKAPQPGALGVVPLVKRSAQTTLVVHDQQTVVIGGLMRNRLTHSEAKIPLLGDIPVLGALFRSSQNSMQKTNLILVLTPYIIREQSDLRTVFERKMQERQEFLDRYFIFSDSQDYQPPHDYSRSNGLVEEIRQGFLSVEERRALDELTRPKDVKTHEPGQPLEMPSHAAGGGARPGAGPMPAGAPGAIPPPPPPQINVAPAGRNLERIER
jgi:general secretion pathway protein D